MKVIRPLIKGKIVLPFGPTTLDEVARCLRYEGKAKTLAQMDSAIAREMVRRRDGHRY